MREVRQIPDPEARFTIPVAGENPAVHAVICDSRPQPGEDWSARARTFYRNALAALEAETGLGLVAAQELSREAIGHYCNMIVADHLSPKGQKYVADSDQPVWFSSVRDTIAFTLLPEEPKNIAAIYVNDMGRASWESPEPETWIEARSAWYVIESSRRGGMGAPEPVDQPHASDPGHDEAGQ